MAGIQPEPIPSVSAIPDRAPGAAPGGARDAGGATWGVEHTAPGSESALADCAYLDDSPCFGTVLHYDPLTGLLSVPGEVTATRHRFPGEVTR